MKNLVTCLWNLNIKLIGLLKLSIQILMMLASCVSYKSMSLRKYEMMHMRIQKFIEQESKSFITRKS